MEIFIILVSAVFVNNFVLSQFLGICPFLGVSKKTDTALGMGIAVTFVMGIASVITYALYQYVLVPLELTYIKTITFIIIIAGLVQAVEIIVKRFSPTLYNALGVYLPLITTNCAVLGVTILNINSQASYTLITAFLNGIFSGIGFTLALLLMAGIRERMTTANIPRPFKGFPITLIAASIMSLAFLAFVGMV